MTMPRLAVLLAFLLAVVFLLGANGGTRYELDGFPMGKQTMGAVRLDTTTGEVCFLAARAEMYLPGGVIEETNADNLACVK